jgi:hypothetical protein
MEYLITFQNFREGPINAIRIQVDAQLANNQTPTRLKKFTIRAKKREKIDHERGEITIIRV